MSIHITKYADQTKNGVLSHQKITKPRLSAVKQADIIYHIAELRKLLGSSKDKAAHTVQLVFTSDKHESVILFQENE